ncbi:hypothetical protein, partial [Photobacterium sanctipauli]
IAGEAFLHFRTYLKTGRSILSYFNDTSTIVYNESFDIQTYRPNHLVKDPIDNRTIMEFNSLGLRSPEIAKKPKSNE